MQSDSCCLSYLCRPLCLSTAITKPMSDLMHTKIPNFLPCIASDWWKLSTELSSDHPLLPWCSALVSASYKNVQSCQNLCICFQLRTLKKYTKNLYSSSLGQLRAQKRQGKGLWVQQHHFLTNRWTRAEHLATESAGEVELRIPLTWYNPRTASSEKCS